MTEVDYHSGVQEEEGGAASAPTNKNDETEKERKPPTTLQNIQAQAVLAVAMRLLVLKNLKKMQLSFSS